jgi:hypothetical protein
MSRLRSLAALNRSFTARIHRLEFIAATVTGRTGAEADRAVAFAIIEALTTWANFSRDFYLACAIRCPKTVTGARVSHAVPNIGNERLALLHAIQVLKPNRYNAAVKSVTISPRDEPTWHEKICLLRLSANIKLSNQASILSGLSYPTTFFNQLPVIRNFYAHRSYITVEKVRNLAQQQYGIGHLQHPCNFINQVHVGSTQTLLSEWLGDMRSISGLLCN